MYITIASTLFLLGTQIVQAETRHAGAHVHGLNRATIILENGTLQISYEFPAAQLNDNEEHKHEEHKHDEHKHDEHKHDEHKHDEHKHDEHKHDELIEHLKEINRVEAIIAMPAGAKCTQTGINHTLRAVASTGTDDEHAGHQDATIEATLDCKTPSALTSLDFTHAFDRFNDLEKIEVEGILGSQSLSKTVTAKKAVISF
jgi:ABC-type Zn2+ transport system substrate-binding protein/surface adhesin